MKMYGEFLDDSQRCETDVNEIVIYDDYAEIVLYDLLFEPLEYGVIIDKEDVEKVKLHCWSKKNGSWYSKDGEKCKQKRYKNAILM